MVEISLSVLLGKSHKRHHVKCTKRSKRENPFVSNFHVIE